MGLRNDCYAKLWSARPYQKVYYVQLSVSQKNQETGEYKIQYSGTAMFAGTAAEKVALLGLPEKSDPENPEGKDAKILSVDISSYYNHKKKDELLELAHGNTKLEYFIREKCNEYTHTVWDFEVQDSGTEKPKQTKKSSKEVDEGFMEVPDDVDENEGLPFDE